MGSGRKIGVWFLFILIFVCSCAEKKSRMAQTSDHENTSVVPNNAGNNLSVTNDNQTNAEKKYDVDYTFKFYNGSYYGLNDLKYFLQDTSVQSIKLRFGSYSDLSPLVELHNLKELDIQENGHITDISPLAALTKLRKLTIFNCFNIESIEAISQLTDLTCLRIYNKNLGKELAPLHNLEILSLVLGDYSRGFPEVDCVFLEELMNLKELSIVEGIYEFINLEKLQNLTKLEKLALRTTSEIEISWITKLLNLKELYLISSTIKDIRPLLELPNLTYINFHSGYVENIELLAGKESLKEMSLPGNIRDAHEILTKFHERGINIYFDGE